MLCFCVRPAADSLSVSFIPLYGEVFVFGSILLSGSGREGRGWGTLSVRLLAGRGKYCLRQQEGKDVYLACLLSDGHRKDLLSYTYSEVLNNAEDFFRRRGVESK